MKAALDVHYENDMARAACVVFEDWWDSKPAELIRVSVPTPSQYRPGRFYERELPCLMSVLQRANREFDTIIIDGFVHLRPGVGKGLGVHLYESLSYSPVIVGVAKRPLKVADHFVRIIRGRSRRPLYISSIGCPVEEAARLVTSMHGSYRIPTLLKIADQLARGSW